MAKARIGIGVVGGAASGTGIASATSSTRIASAASGFVTRALVLSSSDHSSTSSTLSTMVPS